MEKGKLKMTDTDTLPKGGAVKRAHKATYATDKRKGGYLVRVEGPNAAAFVGRDVPVTLKNGEEHPERLERLIWSGNDAESGKPVALYAFASRPRDVDKDEIPF
jgi:hypothetical protein